MAMVVLVLVLLPAVDVVRPTLHHHVLMQSHVAIVPRDLRQRQYTPCESSEKKNNEILIKQLN